MALLQTQKFRSLIHTILKNDLLYHIEKKGLDIAEHLLVPQQYRRTILDLAHSHVLGGHLGSAKNKVRILRRVL